MTHSEYFTDAESNKWSQFAIYPMLDAYAATFANMSDLSVAAIFSKGAYKTMQFTVYSCPYYIGDKLRTVILEASSV